MNVSLSTNLCENFIKKSDYEDKLNKAVEICKSLYLDEDKENVLGWLRTEDAAVQISEIKEKGKEIRENADVFVIVGVGGSNQAARAMLEALQSDGSPEVIYLGNTLSAHYIEKMLKHLDNKSVYINVIAKNFETLEPGSHFRVLRQFMSKKYSNEEIAKRVILTGTYGTRLEEIANENGYMFLSFPKSIGGRYSAFSPVGLLPIASCGLDIDAYLEGVKKAERLCEISPNENPAVEYATIRNLLYDKGFDIEILTSFEPQYAYFAKWWVQLFGESEGKDKLGIFPSSAIYSEDLHSIGQYMQDGRRNLIETFIKVGDTKSSVIIEPDVDFKDNFDYLDDMDFTEINKIAEKATIEAHVEGGVPCIEFSVSEICEETFGSLYYLFMIGCAISGKLLGVNPFDQEGVEAYKKSMFASLKRDKSCVIYR